MLVVPATSQAALLVPGFSCESELDEAVRLFNRGDSNASRIRLEQLTERCTNLPQIQHNLGVIAAEQHDWLAADAYFALAISGDDRTNMTQQHIQVIHEYRASAAFQKALGGNKALTPPELNMQSATIQNDQPAAPAISKAPDAAAIEYELYAWWNAAASNDVAQWLEHYSAGYPVPAAASAHAIASKVKWQNVSRDISFTAHDAVVVLKHKIEAYEQQTDNAATLLLMRLQNNRWKIYKETRL